MGEQEQMTHEMAAVIRENNDLKEQVNILTNEIANVMNHSQTITWQHDSVVKRAEQAEAQMQAMSNENEVKHQAIAKDYILQRE